MYLENQTEKGTFINDNLYENQYSMMISTIRFRGLFNHNYTLICMPKTNLQSYSVGRSDAPVCHTLQRKV